MIEFSCGAVWTWAFVCWKISDYHVTILQEIILLCIEINENENTTTQNLWESVKAVLRGRFIAIQTYLNQQEKHQINNLTLHLNQLEKEE